MQLMSRLTSFAVIQRYEYSPGRERILRLFIVEIHQDFKGIVSRPFSPGSSFTGITEPPVTVVTDSRIA